MPQNSLQVEARSRHFWRSLHPAHWPFFWVMTAFCLIAGENYPFSNFPMYSSFAKNSYFVYLADAAGHPIATTRFGLTNPGLKKIFESKRREQFRRTAKRGENSGNADQAAGAALLQYLETLPLVRAQNRTLLRGLQLRRVDLLWQSGRITAQTRTVAQHE